MSNQEQKDIILAGLAAAGGKSLTPVQIQKLFFIIDREISSYIGGPRFNFKPYDYGPFDREVYDTLEVLALEGSIEIDSSKRYSSYCLTASGFLHGRHALEKFPLPIKKFIADTTAWVLSLSFEELVASIYKKYPDMKENSIFRT